MEKSKQGVEEFWDRAYVGFDHTQAVHGAFFTPGGARPELRDRDLLIVACGTGENVVRAARQGAQVVAVDISKQAVENASKMVQHNGLIADFAVADACRLNFPDRSFDIIWGSAVLHHLDHALAAKEMARLIRPTGVLYFVSEPTFFNPILKLAYRLSFGLDRSNRRNKFFFIKRRGDDFEMPLRMEDLAIWAQYFEVQMIPCGFMFFEKIAHVITGKETIHDRFRSIDLALVKVLPFLKQFSYEYHFTFRPKYNPITVIPSD